MRFRSSTIFISNLPYTATSTDVKTLFSEIAPVKNAFVVLEKETKISKGVGYVTFAMREDAAQCIENGEVDMNGRTLRVTWAGVKVRVIYGLALNLIREPSPNQGKRLHPRSQNQQSVLLHLPSQEFMT